MKPPEDSGAPESKRAATQLQEALEYSREIVRQSQLLIELAESERVTAANDNDCDLDS